jgi:hypothetical protein
MTAVGRGETIHPLDQPSPPGCRGSVDRRVVGEESPFRGIRESTALVTSPRRVSPSDGALLGFTHVLPRMPWARHMAEPTAAPVPSSGAAGPAVTKRKISGSGRAWPELAGLATLVADGRTP